MASGIYYEEAKHIIAASIAMAAVDVLAVAMKFWVRLSFKQPLKADDWLLVPATLLSIGIGSMLTYGAFEGAIGRSSVPPGFTGNVKDFEKDRLLSSRKIQWPFLFLHPLAMGPVRCSFLFLYLRIFSINRTRRLITLSIYMVAAWTLSFFLAELFQCGTHITSNYASVEGFKAHCPHTLWILFAYCLTSFMLDIYILMLPMPFVWKLKLSTAKKLSVTAIFVIGSATVVASGVRFGILTPRLFVSAKGLNFQQRTASLAASLYWGMIEVGVGIFVACLPTVQRIFRGKGALSTRNGTGASSRSYGTSSHMSGSRITNRPRICVDRMVDITYDDTDRDYKPILSRIDTPEAQRHQKSEESVVEIELQSDLRTPEQVNTQRTYPRY